MHNTIVHVTIIHMNRYEVIEVRFTPPVIVKSGDSHKDIIRATVENPDTATRQGPYDIPPNQHGVIARENLGPISEIVTRDWDDGDIVIGYDPTYEVFTVAGSWENGTQNGRTLVPGQEDPVIIDEIIGDTDTIRIYGMYYLAAISSS